MRLGYRLGLTLFTTTLSRSSVVGANEVESFVDRMPRAYSGEFRWGDGQPAQTTAITFDPVRTLSDEKVEALGCAAYGHETPN